MATLHYSVLTGKSVQPYIGLSVGGNLIMPNQYLGKFANGNNKFGLAARPELGLFIPVIDGSETGLNIAAAFNLMPYNKNR